MPDAPRRRPTGEVRQLLIDAAAEVFAESGLDKPLMTDIAERAGVHRSVMYRHFATKEELFRVAVAQPFVEFIEEFSRTWRAQLESPLPDELLLRTYLSELYSSFAQHRSAIRILLSSQTRSGGDGADLYSGTLPALNQLTKLLTDGMGQRGFPTVHVDLTQRFIFFVIIGFLLFDEHLTPAGRSTPPDVFLTHLTSFILYGVRLGPGAGRDGRTGPEISA